MTRSQTIRESCLFKVSEVGDGTPWISLEPRERVTELSKILKGTDIRRAKTIADFLTIDLADLAVTFFDGASIRP